MPRKATFFYLFHILLNPDNKWSGTFNVIQNLKSILEIHAHYPMPEPYIYIYIYIYILDVWASLRAPRLIPRPTEHPANLVGM